ncbi:MAG: sigma-70 family RNA polymerase sigma factor [Zhenhengia sp.]|uniref:sigma-70 family RNA polymerase sigma factor n=1 Tax=Zhenhengia sp. TaxID=2944208 RepID=UPI0039917A26
MESIIEIEQQEIVEIERMMREYGDTLLRMCIIYLKDRALAEDAVQETFIKVYQKYYTFNQISEEKTWIMRIAINVCKNYMRTSWFKRVKTGLDLETISKERIDQNFIERERQKQILSEIAELERKYKEVILLYYYQEMSTKEIASILHIKEGTVRVRLQRPRQKLSVQLEEGEKL